MSEKERHTFSKCNGCFEITKEHQAAFPLRPIYTPEQPMVPLTIDPAALKSQGVKNFTKQILQELNEVYTSEASMTFTDALLQTKSAGLERKKNKTERRDKRKVHREVTQRILRRKPLSHCWLKENPREGIIGRGWLNRSALLVSRHPRKRKHTPLNLMPFLGTLQNLNKPFVIGQLALLLFGGWLQGSMI